MSKLKVFDGVTFYPAATEGKTLKQFIEHEAHHGFPDAAMKDIYEKLSPKAEEKPAPVKEKDGK